MDTTGTKVICESKDGLMICEDAGAYPGTIPSMNVRKLKLIKRFAHLHLTHPSIFASLRMDRKYGCGICVDSALFPVDAAGIEALEALEAAEELRKAEAAARKATPEWRSARGLTLTEEMNSEDTMY